FFLRRAEPSLLICRSFCSWKARLGHGYSLKTLRLKTSHLAMEGRHRCCRLAASASRLIKKPCNVSASQRSISIVKEIMPPRRRAALLLSSNEWNRWERLTQEPRKTQEKFLFRLIRDNQKTAFGRDHRFSEIRTIADYRKQVSVGDYERFRPYIDRARHG